MFLRQVPVIPATSIGDISIEYLSGYVAPYLDKRTTDLNVNVAE